jgi:hypothetical protein
MLMDESKRAESRKGKHMKTKYYERQNCPEIPEGYNKGEAVEWRIGYEKTGTPSLRNNKPAIQGGDVGEWQVKSPKASIAKEDNCGGYIFGFADADYYYEMSRAEFEEFLQEFSYTDYDSRSKKTKIRIKNESSLLPSPRSPIISGHLFCLNSPASLLSQQPDIPAVSE